MTPKEKAQELVNRFSSFETDFSYDGGYSFEKLQSSDAKKCALICVNDILEIFEGLHKPEYVLFDIYEPKKYHNEEVGEMNGYNLSEYWEQVKEEIEKL